MKMEITGEEIGALFQHYDQNVTYIPKTGDVPAHFSWRNGRTTAKAFLILNKDCLGLRVPLTSIKLPVTGSLFAGGAIPLAKQNLSKFKMVQVSEKGGEMLITIPLSYLHKQFPIGRITRILQHPDRIVVEFYVGK